ncbi:uncharacterized protein LOC119402512 [Rhipicephalus sanguineus]|uniref:uncharacterized protein LOC119402512 n=1 Tax=Rhipicephalus sanguineus TaxID=34632 RepID=UPI0020C37FB6|nr:uncharacterized protein LOC119402512 [Rhipicephalus sanguineus]
MVMCLEGIEGNGSATEIPKAKRSVQLLPANLRLAATSYPQIQITVSGVEFNTEDAYVDRQEGYLYDRGTVNKLQSYAQAKKSAYGNPDFVYLFTGEDLYTRYGGYLTAAGLGIAFVASVCESTFVGLGEDEAGLFTGMHTFTHETCHILGARHDGSDPDAGIPGHPGSKNCPWDDGYMMSYVNKGPNHQVFSWCSLQQMEFVVRLRGPKCWAHGDEENVVEHVYPGMAVSMKEFCMNIYREDKSYVEFDKSEVNPMTCRVKCRYNKYTWHDYYRTNPETMTREDEALDHTPCGKNMVCMQSICKEQPKETRFEERASRSIATDVVGDAKMQERNTLNQQRRYEE